MRLIIAVFITGALFIMLGCSKGSDQPANTSGGDTSSASTSARLWKIYKDSIPGTYTWHHTYIQVAGPDTTYHIDTVEVARIDLVNDSTLSFGGIPLSYSDTFQWAPFPYGGPVDTTNFLFYWQKGQYGMEKGNPKNLMLNRHNDSLIYFVDHTGTALGSQTYEHFRTKISH